MHLAALLVALIVCAVGIALGSRFLLAPRKATLAYGVAEDNLRALTALQLDPSAHAPWTRTIFGREFMFVIPFVDSS